MGIKQILIGSMSRVPYPRFFFTAREMCPLSACSFSRGVTSNPDNAKRKLRVHVLLLLLKAKTITEFTRDTGNELANRVVA